MIDSAKMARKRPLTAACLSVGGGIFCQGLKRAGVKVLWASETGLGAAETFAAYHPEVKILNKPVAELSAAKDKLPPVDILTAALPRRDFARAVRERSFGEAEARFFSEVIRLVKEFGENRPPVALLENVPHLKTGKFYPQLMRIMLDLRFAGYWFNEDYDCRVMKTKTGSRLFMAAASTADCYCNDIRFPQHDNRKDGNTPLHAVVANLAESCVAFLHSDSRRTDKWAA